MISACNVILISWQDTPSFSASIFFFYFDKNLGENLGEILIQIFLGEFLAAEILRSRRDPAENLGEISWRSRQESRRVFGRRDLAGISPAKNSPRFSPRSRSKFCRGCHGKVMEGHEIWRSQTSTNPVCCHPVFVTLSYSPTSSCDHLSSATRFQKYQKFPSHIIIIVWNLL